MPNTLIYKDQQRIDAVTAALNNAVPFIQNVHDALVAINVTLTKEEMILLLNTKSDIAANKRFSLEDFVKDKLIENIDEVTSQGIVLFDKKALRTIIPLPDMTGFNAVFTQQAINEKWVSPKTKGNLPMPLITTLIQVVDGTYSKVADADTQIDSAFTYKTTTAKGDNITNKLKALCDALNVWLPFASQYGLPGDINNGNKFGDGNYILGINILHDNTCVPSVHYVQTYEKF